MVSQNVLNNVMDTKFFKEEESLPYFDSVVLKTY